jgi:hypothetical protein
MLSAQEVEYSANASGGSAIVILIFEAVFGILYVAGLWKTFAKAGEPGWAAIVPIYNAIVILKLGGKPWWWVLIPVVGPIMLIIAQIELAKRFGKGAGFGIGLVFLPFIFYPMLGFGPATAGPAVAPAR